MMRVLVAMSGGVDSSVAAALLRDAGHHTVGVTMRLWGGTSDTGCCSVADVDDARRVAQQLDIDHVVFNFSSDFDAHVVAPYVAAHGRAMTPNPCIECNRHLKFARLAERADVLGFDAIATGHHARIALDPSGARRVRRGADRDKDQSYVVHMLRDHDLARTLFPVGEMTKVDVRVLAERLGLRTAAKPDSQDVCFITTSGGRAAFLGERIPLRRATVVDRDGNRLGAVDAMELVTVGQRKGIGRPGGGPARFVTGVDPVSATITVGDHADTLVARQPIDSVEWAGSAVTGDVLAQSSAHGRPEWATIVAGDRSRPRSEGSLRSTDSSLAASVAIWRQPQRRVAPGQTIVLYDPTDTFVLGAAIAA